MKKTGIDSCFFHWTELASGYIFSRGILYTGKDQNAKREFSAIGILRFMDMDFCFREERYLFFEYYIVYNMNFQKKTTK